MIATLNMGSSLLNFEMAKTFPICHFEFKIFPLVPCPDLGVHKQLI